MVEDWERFRKMSLEEVHQFICSLESNVKSSHLMTMELKEKIHQLNERIDELFKINSRLEKQYETARTRLSSVSAANKTLAERVLEFEKLLGVTTDPSFGDRFDE